MQFHFSLFLFNNQNNQKQNKNMKKLMNKNMHVYYLVVLYFLTFAALLIMFSACSSKKRVAPSYSRIADKCPNWSLKHTSHARN